MLRIARLARRSHRRGSILAVSLMMILLISFSSVMLARAVIDHKRLNDRRRELSKAFYLAEAGANLVSFWALDPSEYTPSTALFARDADGVFAQLIAAIGSSGYTIPDSMLDSFTTAHGDDAGRIKEVELLPTEPGDPAAAICRVRSVGESPLGIERTVIYLAEADPIFNMEFPAGLVSHATVGLSGASRIHWGEAWAKDDIDMISESQADHLDATDVDYDPWARFRTEGKINFPASWDWGLGDDLIWFFGTRPGAWPASTHYAEAFHQYLPSSSIDWQDYASTYEAARTLARRHGRYYSTDAAGNIYRDGVETGANQVDFLLEFGVADRSNAPADFVFIDTIDGAPPAADGSNLATIHASGTGLGLKGLYWIGANFDAGGVGSPPASDGVDPGGDGHTLTKIFLEGALYAAGRIEFNANTGVYGSVVAERGFQGSGSPDIYYDATLAGGIPYPFVGPIRLTLWANY